MTTAPHIDTHLNTEALATLHAHLAAKLNKHGVTATLNVRELTLSTPLASITQVLTTLRDDKKCQFQMLIDITAVDWLGAGDAKPESAGESRFEVVYHLLSTSQNLRVRVKVPVDESESIPTATGIWPAANWFEREVWDMFGLKFGGHPDLRRILTDYDFDGHPLRKDFPLTGHVEVYYDTTEKRVAYKPLDLPQDFRRFDNQSPWSGVTGNAPLADTDNTFRKEEFK